MDRREFMRLAAVAAGGAATLAGTGRLLTRPAFADLAAAQVRPLPDPRNSGLDHIVVMMMENRSYDSYLWWLPGGDGIRDQTFHDENGDEVHTENYGINGRAEFDGCAQEDPHHGWDASREQYLHGFAAHNAEYGMAWYEEVDLPAHSVIAREFTAFDRWFCSVLGPTFPNREYLAAGTSGGMRGNCFAVPGNVVADAFGQGGRACDPSDLMNAQGDTSNNGAPDAGFDWPSIMDRLNDAGVSWRLYVHDLSVYFQFGERILSSGNIFMYEQYLADCAAGTLPQVALVEPRFDNAYTGCGNDDHWPHDIRLGQKLIGDTYNALVGGPQWPSSALVVTYDEHGGFFDHVTPPRTRDDRANAGDFANDYGQLGFRVPTVVASPFARREYVAHPTYDHTSILKMIEWRFGLAPLTVRDAAARNMAETFDWDNPVTDAPEVDTSIPQLNPLQVNTCPGGQQLFPDEQARVLFPEDLTDEVFVNGTDCASLGNNLPANAQNATVTPDEVRQAGTYRAYAAAPERDHDISRLFEEGMIERMGFRLPWETGSETVTRIRRYA